MQENPMPPIEELRKKVDEDWASGKIGPANTDGFDEAGRRVEEAKDEAKDESKEKEGAE